MAKYHCNNCDWTGDTDESKLIQVTFDTEHEFMDICPRCQHLDNGLTIEPADAQESKAPRPCSGQNEKPRRVDAVEAGGETNSASGGGADFATKWNKRMDEIGAERGTIEDLKGI